MFNLHLPTVEIIAGDTCPFIFNVSDLSHMEVETSNCVAYLSISPYVNESEDPLYSAEQNTITNGELIFEIPAEVSVNLRGKYIYQLFLSNSRQTEIYEGYLVVYANRNKAVVGR